MVLELEERNVVHSSTYVQRGPGAATMLSTLVALCLNPPKRIENIFLEVPESESEEASGSSPQQSGSGDAGSGDDKGGISRASDSREEGSDRKRRRLSEKDNVIDSSNNKVFLPRASINLDLSALTFKTAVPSRCPVLSVVLSGQVPQRIPKQRLVFELDRFVSCGRLWDVFEGTLRGRATGEDKPSSSSAPLPDSTGIPVVLKLAVWDHDTGADRGFVWPREDHYAYTHEEKMEHAWNEARLFDGPLKPLQGSVVPRCYGAYKAEIDTGGTVFGIILEYLGKSPPQEYISLLHGRHQKEVVRLYSALHKQQIVHGDIEVRHLRTAYPFDPVPYGKEFDLRLIDFEGAKVGSREEVDEEFKEVLWRLKG